MSIVKSLCIYFTRNACNRGKDCSFTHSREDDVPGAESAPSISACKFHQRGLCKFGNSCKNLHQPALVTSRANEPPAQAPCIFFARGQCIKGDACSFVHRIGTELRSQDAIDPSHANSSDPCRFWSKGACKKGDACPLVHPETIPSTDDRRPESPVPTPNLTSRTPTTGSDEFREISTLQVETAGLEVHMPHAFLVLEETRQKVCSQEVSEEMMADTALDSSSKSILPLNLDPDTSSHTLSTGSVEGCRTKIPLATSSTSVSPVSCVKITPTDSHQEFTSGEDSPSDASPSNISSKECGERLRAASVVGPISHTTDNCPDGGLCGSHRTTPLQDNGMNPSYEQNLTMEGIEYTEEAEPVGPALVQNSTGLLQSDPLHEQDLDSEGDNEVVHPLLTTTKNLTIEYPKEVEPVALELVQNSTGVLQSDSPHEQDLDSEVDIEVHPLLTSTKNLTMEGIEYPEEAEPVVLELVQNSTGVLQSDLPHEQDLDSEGDNEVVHPLLTTTKNLTMEGIEYLEEAEPIVPEFVRNSTGLLQSDPPHEQDLDPDDNHFVHPRLTSMEDVPHWSQYADPLADPAIPFCNFFAQGRCNQGYACSFRHSITVNEYALLFRDPQPPLWSSRAQVTRTENVIPSTVSAFGVCKFYPLGTCRNGESCPYLHAPPTFTQVDSWPNEGWASSTEPGIRSNSGREVRPCRYYVENGYCNKGDECRFRHHMDDQFPHTTHNNQEDGWDEWHNNDDDQEVNRRTRPCKYFREGNCRKGDRCSFLHDNANTEEEPDGGWAETASNGWGEAADADGWGAPNAADWGDPTTDGLVKKDGTDNERTPMTDGVDGLADVKSRRMGNATSPANDGTTWATPRRARDSGVCHLYTRGQCHWGTRCKYRHDRPDNDLPSGDSWGTQPGHNQVENDPPTVNSWGETIETLPGVPPQAEETPHDTVGSETPENTWGETTEMPSHVAAREDQPFQASTGDLTPQDNDLGQPDEPKSAATSNIHKWALNVVGETMESQSHDDDEKTWSTPWTDDVIQSTTPARIHAPCKAFGQGYCSWGESCLYQHIAPPDPVLEAQSPTAAEGSATEMPEDLEIAGDQAGEIADPDVHLSVDRNLFNCTMCFSSGCLPTNILTACESRRIRLSNISPTLTHDDLRDIVNSFGMVLDLVIDAGEESANASIVFEDSAQALDAIAHLDGQTYDSMVVAARLDTIAMEWAMQPLVSRMLKLSWLPPILSAWAMYPTITIAKMQEKRLDGWTFNGRKIKAEFHRPRPKQTHSFGVKLTGLPTQTIKKSLEELCEESTMVVLEPVTYQSQPVNNAICDLLANLGPLESFDIPSWDGSQSRIVGFAHFRMDMTSLEGVMALNAAPQPFLGGSSLNIQQVFHAKYDLSNRLFHALRSEIDRLTSVHKPYCSVSYYENGDQGNVVLHIYGDFKDPKKFGCCNIELQALLQGEILMSEGKREWDEYFDISSSAKTLEKVNADSPFFIQVDKRTQAIHIIGSESSRQAGRTMVSRLLKKVRAQRCVIPVDMFSLHGLLTGGYQSLQDDMGPNKVTLDVVASELIVRGGSDVVDHVRLSLDARASISPNDSPAPNLVEGGTSCPVCYRKPTNPIKLFCGHAYCQACLQHVLQTSVGLRFSPPMCIATAAGEKTEQGQQCTEKIPYAVVRDLLRTDEEEQLLQSFAKHVEFEKQQQGKQLFFFREQSRQNSATTRRFALILAPFEAQKSPASTMSTALSKFFALYEVHTTYSRS